MGIMRYGIHYTGYPRVLERYSDSNWISDVDEMKATSRAGPEILGARGEAQS
jgi:hypothetical protein